MVNLSPLHHGMGRLPPCSGRSFPGVPPRLAAREVVCWYLFLSGQTDAEFTAVADSVKGYVPGPGKVVTNEDKLAAYGLFKQATVGDVNTDRSGPSASFPLTIAVHVGRGCGGELSPHITTPCVWVPLRLTDRACSALRLVPSGTRGTRTRVRAFRLFSCCHISTAQFVATMRFQSPFWLVAVGPVARPGMSQEDAKKAYIVEIKRQQAFYA